MQDVGTAMLEDGIFTTGKWLKDPANQAIADEVPRRRRSRAGSTAATTRRSASNIVLKNGPTLPKGHQTLADERDQQARSGRAPNGIGVMDPAAYKRTAADRARSTA